MNVSSHRHGDESDSDAALRRVIAQRSLVVVTARTGSGWMMLRSRFLPGPAAEVLRIERPRACRNERPRFARGQSIGLSFRVGHTKFVLETEVLEAGTDGIDGPLTLGWPDCVQQLQRRMYVRYKIPSAWPVPLTLYHAQDMDRDPTALPDATGRLLDVSPGGVGVAVSGGCVEDWHAGQTVRCAVQLEPDRPPWDLAGRVCYARGWENDSVRVGLQFADGQAARLGRTAHRQIVQAAGRLKHATAPSLAGLS